MKRTIIIAIGFCFVVLSAAWAYSTATQMIAGFLTVTSCPGNQTPCFMQYSTANPLQTSVQ